MGIRLPNGVGVDDDAAMNEQIMATMAGGGSKRSAETFLEQKWRDDGSWLL